MPRLLASTRTPYIPIIITHHSFLCERKKIFFHLYKKKKKNSVVTRIKIIHDNIIIV